MDTNKPNLCETNQDQDQSEKLKIENSFLKQMFKRNNIDKIINNIDLLLDQALNVLNESKNEKSCPI
jgi:hypothetical protein